MNRKTVLKWRRRDGVTDAPMGARELRSTVLSEVEEAAVVAFRVQIRLPLDDVVGALRPSIPGLTRSSAHRALQRQGVSRLPRARDRAGASSRPTRSHVADYLTAYNYAKHLKALRWRTPVETLEALWATKAELFRRSPDHLTLGPNT